MDGTEIQRQGPFPWSLMHVTYPAKYILLEPSFYYVRRGVKHLSSPSWSLGPLLKGHGGIKDRLTGLGLDVEGQPPGKMLRGDCDRQKELRFS